jgi:transcriptional regulator with XRE-family HTH domain
METFAERLRVARMRRVLTQEQLAAASGVPVVTISRLENSYQNRTPRQGTVQRLAAALDVSPAWLLYGEDLEDVTGGKVAA